MRVVTTLQPIILYNGGAALTYDTAPGAGTKDTVTLSETAANFSKLKIFYYTGQYGAKSSVEVAKPNGNNVSMFCCTVSFQAMVITSRVAYINGKSITTQSDGSNPSYGVAQYRTTGVTILWNNDITIYRVEGIR